MRRAGGPTAHGRTTKSGVHKYYPQTSGPCWPRLASGQKIALPLCPLCAELKVHSLPRWMEPLAHLAHRPQGLCLQSRCSILLQLQSPVNPRTLNEILNLSESELGRSLSTTTTTTIWTGSPTLPASAPPYTLFTARRQRRLEPRTFRVTYTPKIVSTSMYFEPSSVVELTSRSHEGPLLRTLCTVLRNLTPRN